MKCENCRWYNTEELGGACEQLTKRGDDGIYYVDEESECVIPDERECCTNCRLSVKLEIWDYSNPHIPKYDTPGYVCMLFANEGLVVNMLGHDPDNGLCEGIILRAKNDND